MKDYLLKALCFLALAVTTFPIAANDYLKIYFKDGHTERHYMKLVESISATRYDLEGVMHSDYQMQQIIMKDTTYSYYIADIDSMSFSKVDEEQVRSRVELVQSSLLPIFQQCSKIEDLASHIDEIKSIDGVENVYTDGKDLVIQIQDWFDICFDHIPIPDDVSFTTSELSRQKARGIIPTTEDGSPMKVTIGFQMVTDNGFAEAKKTIDELNREFSDLKYKPNYTLGEAMDFDFFYRRIFDSNLLLIDTHGGCGIFNKKHYLYTGIAVKHGWSSLVGYEILKPWGVSIENIDLDDIGITCCNHSDGGWFGEKFFLTVKEDFIRKSPYRFTGSGPHIVFIAACSSLQGSEKLTRSDGEECYGSDSFAQVFFDKGADVYLGYNRGTYRCSWAAHQFYDYLLHGASVEVAFNKLDPLYKFESDKDEKAELIDLYNPSSKFKNPKSIFGVKTKTVKKTEQEFLNDYKNSKEVLLKGKTVKYSLDYGINDFGFRIATKPNVHELTNYEELISSDQHFSGNNTGEVDFSATYSPEPGKTYYYCAVTYDGKYFNWGEERIFKIPEEFADLALSSTSPINLKVGESTTVEITSGSGEYGVTNLNGDKAKATLNGTTITIEALAAGDAKVVVTDVKTGQKETIEITVIQNLQLSATKLSLVEGSSGTVEITAGSGEYGVTNLNGDKAKATLNGTTITIEALSVGDAKVVVTDMKSGLKVTIEISVTQKTVYPELTLSKQEVHLNVGETGQIEITSGTGSYSIGKYDTNVAKVTINGSTITINALSIGNTPVTITDKGSGKTATFGIAVKKPSIYDKDAVDLGLSVKWAKMNVGAVSEEDYGEHYAWGETESKSYFSWSSYAYCNGTPSTITKYNSHDGKTSLEPADDAANIVMGGDWYTPTKAEMDELKDRCQWKLETLNGEKVYRVTGPNGKSIVLPLGGNKTEDTWNNLGSMGCYSVSTLSSEKTALGLSCHGETREYKDYQRYIGLSIRAVLRK